MTTSNTKEDLSIDIIEEKEQFFTIISKDGVSIHKEGFYTEAAASMAKDLLTKRYLPATG